MGEVIIKGICRICGEPKKGTTFCEWVKGTFTNHSDLKQGDVICEDCLFKFDEASEILAQKVGKEKPQRMRNYSHFICNGEWIPLGKDKKEHMADLILNHNCEYVVISESGQKHIWFRAKSGMWQFEEHSIVPNKDLLRQLLCRIERMLDVFSKKEIFTGRFNQRRILEFGLHFWRQLDSDLRNYRGSSYLKLALFLGQKNGQFRKHCPEPTRSDMARSGEGIQAEIFS